MFTGVGKSPDEIDRAVQLGLKAINAESAGELERIDRAAQARGVRARVALRVNPDIDAGTHPHISTGLHINKFGVPLEQARAIYRKMVTQPGLQPVGIHVHLGSQIVTLDPLQQRRTSTVVKLAQELADVGMQIDHIDVGGGLGISYDGSHVPAAARYAASVLPILWISGCRSCSKPGRLLVGAAGALLVARRGPEGRAGGPAFRRSRCQHDRADPAGAVRRVSSHRSGDARVRARELRYDVVGPVCESSDAFGAGPSVFRRSRWATCWRFSMPARTARRWPRTTTGARCRRK